MPADRSHNGDGAKKYVYYPGCSLKSTGLAYEESFLAVFQLLDLPFEELPDWNCCGATSYMDIEEDSAFVLAARNLSLAKSSGATDILAPCSACYLVLRKAEDYHRRYPVIREKVDAALKRARLEPLADNCPHVRHPLEVLYNDVGPERLRAKVSRRWEGGPIACYYGCQVVRPYGEVDNPVNPVRMEELLEAAGIPTIEYGLKTKCCGGSLTGTIHEVGLRLNYVLLKDAHRRGAQAVVTICPLCQFNLDVYQNEIRKDTWPSLDMPILYLTQVLGWVLGADFQALGLHRSVSGRKLIREWFSRKEEESYV
jgi:heterodisulfide reductase subunit B